MSREILENYDPEKGIKGDNEALTFNDSSDSNQKNPDKTDQQKESEVFKEEENNEEAKKQLEVQYKEPLTEKKQKETEGLSVQPTTNEKLQQIGDELLLLIPLNQGPQTIENLIGKLIDATKELSSRMGSIETEIVQIKKKLPKDSIMENTGQSEDSESINEQNVAQKFPLPPLTKKHLEEFAFSITKDRVNPLNLQKAQKYLHILQSHLGRTKPLSLNTVAENGYFYLQVPSDENGNEYYYLIEDLKFLEYPQEMYGHIIISPDNDRIKLTRTAIGSYIMRQDIFRVATKLYQFMRLLRLDMKPQKNQR